jgi:integrase
MKVPKAKRLPSGSWHIQLRLGGQSISITEPTEKLCTQRAQLVKAEYLAGKKQQKIEDANLTLARAIEVYCEDRSNSLSPATIRKYYNIKKNHFQDLMGLRLDRITDRQWQRSVNAMLARYAPITVDRSVGMVKTVVLANAVKFPPVTVGKASAQKAKDADKCQFLEPEEILLFVREAAKTPYAVPLLLALSSLRIAEIDGLDWADVTKDVIRVRRVRIQDKDGNWILKAGAKTEGSVRDVPVFIPELQAALDRERKPEGKLMTTTQEALRRACKRVCAAAGVPCPGVHGLRHSFASLCASDQLQIPMHVSQKIGGWENDKVMREIYTHVARSDVAACISRLKAFYANENANEIAKP